MQSLQVESVALTQAEFAILQASVAAPAARARGEASLQGPWRGSQSVHDGADVTRESVAQRPTRPSHCQLLIDPQKLNSANS